MMGKKKYGAIDIAKYVSALLVVCIHTFPFYEVSVRLNAYWIQTVCRLAVPFFFVSSGFFFFRKWDKNHPEANQEALSRYEKRLGKIYLDNYLFAVYDLGLYTGRLSLLSHFCVSTRFVVKRKLLPLMVFACFDAFNLACGKNLPETRFKESFIGFSDSLYYWVFD